LIQKKGDIPDIFTWDLPIQFGLFPKEIVREALRRQVKLAAIMLERMRGGRKGR